MRIGKNTDVEYHFTHLFNLRLNLILLHIGKNSGPNNFGPRILLFTQIDFLISK